MTSEVIKQDPLSGHLFVFRNRRSDRVKILYWDTDGYAVWAKRLEEGSFRFPENAEGGAAITPTELAMMLGGVESHRVHRQERYSLELVHA